MTREEFRKYIRENIVILDGATGTNPDGSRHAGRSVSGGMGDGASAGDS